MADKSQSIHGQLNAILNRIEKLELAAKRGGVPPGSADGPSFSNDFGLGSCALPEVPERTLAPGVSSYREGLIRYIGKKWVNGTKLKYYMFDNGPYKGVPSNEDLVRASFKAWEDVGIGIEFEEVTDINVAQVRIGFLRDNRSWSYVGRDVVDIPGRLERTMNFGWDLTQDSRGGGLDTPIHEIGHTLGFPHEHQNPFSGIVWDEEAVYRAFAGPPNNWPRQTTFHNILRKLSPQEVAGSNWDPNSIMHYGFGPGMIVEPAQYNKGLRPTDGLTDIDKAEARKFYPPLKTVKYKKLEPSSLEKMSIGPGEQSNFSIEVDRSDKYTIQTFGKSDSVMVLFEEVNGEMEFVAGDDDSGTSLNAKITTRLVRTRKYVLRIRLYLNWATGDTAVMLS